VVLDDRGGEKFPKDLLKGENYKDRGVNMIKERDQLNFLST